MPSESPPPRWAALAPWPAGLATALPATVVPELCADLAATLERDDLDGLLLDATLAPGAAAQLSRARARGPLVLALGSGAQLEPALAAGVDAVARWDDPLAWHLGRLAQATRQRRQRHLLRGQLALLLGRAELLQDGARSDPALAARAASVVEAALELRRTLDAWPRVSI